MLSATELYSAKESRYLSSIGIGDGGWAPAILGLICGADDGNLVMWDRWNLLHPSVEMGRVVLIIFKTL